MKLVVILRAALSAFRTLGPYALPELLLPGGALPALLWYLYRRRTDTSAGSSRPADFPAACSS
ncbi:MAG TPA: hypothetical protein VEG26_01165 [Steroidobacteraceae bacterium]|nr:hypothetical protein [Steroidobacteraceae bacterium]